VLNITTHTMLMVAAAAAAAVLKGEVNNH